MVCKFFCEYLWQQGKHFGTVANSVQVQDVASQEVNFFLRFLGSTLRLFNSLFLLLPFWPELPPPTVPGRLRS